MKINALITTLAIVGSSSAAMARPVTFSASAEASWGFGYHDRPVIRDHRYREPVPAPIREPMMFPSNNALTEDASVYQGPLPAAEDRSYGYGYSGAWLSITAPTRIDRGRQFVTDLPDLGRFHTVRLYNVTGSTAIGSVLIRFKNGEEQVVHVNQTLDRWSPTIDIRLHGARKIHGFVLYGSSAHGAAYQILVK